MTGDYKFYGVGFSYFSGIVRSYLQYKRIPYIDHVADISAFRDVILPRTGLKFVPVVITPQNEALQDSSDIVDTLELRHPDRPVFPQDPTTRLAVMLVETYAQEFLLYPGLSMRWIPEENHKWVYGEFGRNALWRKRGADYTEVGHEFAGRIERYLPGLGLDKTEIVAASRKAFDGCLDKLEAILEKREFLLGSSPCYGDFCMFGPVYSHWMNDPAPAAIVHAKYPRVFRWADRLLSANALPAHTDWAIDDVFLDFLAEAATGFGRMFTDSVAALNALFADLNDGDEIPRGGPAYDTELYGEALNRRLNTYWGYMFSRIWETYAAIDDRAQVENMLAKSGWLDQISKSPAWRIVKNEQRKLALKHS